MSAPSDADSIPSTYFHIYRFLKSRGLDSAAKALKKAVKDTIVLRDDIPTEEPLLHDIVVQWKKLVEEKNKLLTKSGDSSSDSDSSDEDSDSDSSSEDDSESSDSSDADSSSDSHSDVSSTPVISKKAAKQEKVGKERANAPSASSDSGSDDDSDKPASPEKPAKIANVQPEKNGKKTKRDEVNGRDDNTIVAKKRKVTENTSVVTAITTIATPKPQESAGSTVNEKKKGPRKSNTPFQRIKTGDVQFVNERLKDNSYQAKGGVVNDYGEKANKDLIVTRGAGFRKEKNKKKRGSYRGGEITMQSHSIIFE